MIPELVFIKNNGDLISKGERGDVKGDESALNRQFQIILLKEHNPLIIFIPY